MKNFDEGVRVGVNGEKFRMNALPFKCFKQHCCNTGCKRLRPTDDDENIGLVVFFWRKEDPQSDVCR